MRYIILAYKCSNDDYCMGCHMESWDSDLETIDTEDRERAIEFMFEILKRNSQKDCREASYEFQYFLPTPEDDFSSEFYEAEKRLTAFEEQEKQRKIDLKAKALEAGRLAQLAHDQAEFKRLAAKLGATS